MHIHVYIYIYIYKSEENVEKKMLKRRTDSI